MEDFREEEALGKAYDSRLMKRLLRYARPYWLSLVGCLCLILIITFLSVYQPLLIKQAIDGPLGLFKPGHGLIDATARQGALNTIMHLALLFLGSVVAISVLQYVQALLMQFTGQRIIRRIRQEIFDHLQGLNLAFFDKNPVGRLVTRVTNDTEALNEMYTSVLVNLFNDLFTLLAIIIMMYRVNASYATVAISILPVVGVATFFFQKQVRAAWREVRTLLSRINATIAENLSGMKVVQIFRREAEQFKEFAAINDRYRVASMRQLYVFAVFRPAIDLLSNIALAVVMWYGAAHMMNGTIAFGVVYVFITYIRQAFQPLNQLAEKFNIIQSAMASSERIFQLLDTAPEVRDPETAVAARHDGSVEFDHVWFAYEDENWVLRDVNFRVEPGQTVAFVGHTGAGKSSIMNLLARFYDVQKGTVRVGGIDVRDMKQDDLRKAIGIVLQDVFLFTGDIQYNIRLNNPDISFERLQAAAKAVGAHDFIMKLPGGYDEAVVERGATLSSGQRQLLAFARALAFDPKILVLDEATANIDSETEALIQQALKRLTQGRTTLIVAHRLSTIQQADQIVVLHKGKIREVGNHQQLLAQQGLYYKLWTLQYAEQRKAAVAAMGEPVSVSAAGD